MSPKQAYSGLTYNIIDADAHVNEPPDLWQKRVPKELKDRAPKGVHLPDGNDGWSLEDGKTVRKLGITGQMAGMQSNEVTKDRIVTFAGMRPSNWDPRERIKDMELDGIHAAVVYSTFALGGAAAFGNDPEMQLACVRAYNDWLHEEFCAPSNGRLFGAALVPITGVEDAVAEMEYVKKRGLNGVVIGRWPNGSQMPSPADDHFWAAAQEMNMPVCIHVGNAFTVAADATAPLQKMESIALGTLNKCGATSMPIVDSLIGQNVPGKFPRLKLSLVEANVGWIPCYLEQADDRWMHYRWIREKLHLKMAPSDQFRRNFWASFMCDPIGVELRHHIGVDRIMWATDFPHGGTEWPNTRSQLDRLFRGVPENEVKMMIHDNACTFYGLTGV